MSRSIIRAERRVTARHEWRQRIRRWLASDAATPYAFLAVPLLLFTLIKFYLVLYNFVLSFTSYDLFSPMRFVGLRNYQQVFTEEVTLKAIRNTLLLTVGAVPISAALALVVAALLNQPIRGKIILWTDQVSSTRIRSGAERLSAASEPSHKHAPIQHTTFHNLSVNL